MPTRHGAIDALLKPQGIPAGLIVYLHGGGWVIRLAAGFRALARLIVARSGCAVLLPDYRLAPEHPFPAGLEDSEDAVRFAAGHVEALCGRRVPLAVAGDSAGGQSRHGRRPPAEGRGRAGLPGSFYPVADADFDRPSYRDLSDGMPLSRADMIWFFDHYAPRARHGDPDIAPLPRHRSRRPAAGAGHHRRIRRAARRGRGLCAQAGGGGVPLRLIPRREPDPWLRAAAQTMSISPSRPSTRWRERSAMPAAARRELSHEASRQGHHQLRGDGVDPYTDHVGGAAGQCRLDRAARRWMRPRRAPRSCICMPARRPMASPPRTPADYMRSCHASSRAATPW